MKYLIILVFLSAVTFFSYSSYKKEEIEILKASKTQTIKKISRLFKALSSNEQEVLYFDKKAFEECTKFLDEKEHDLNSQRDLYESNDLSFSPLQQTIQKSINGKMYIRSPNDLGSKTKYGYLIKKNKAEDSFAFARISNFKRPFKTNIFNNINAYPVYITTIPASRIKFDLLIDIDPRRFAPKINTINNELNKITQTRELIEQVQTIEAKLQKAGSELESFSL